MAEGTAAWIRNMNIEITFWPSARTTTPGFKTEVPFWSTQKEHFWDKTIPWVSLKLNDGYSSAPPWSKVLRQWYKISGDHASNFLFTSIGTLAFQKFWFCRVRANLHFWAPSPCFVSSLAPNLSHDSWAVDSGEASGFGLGWQGPLSGFSLAASLHQPPRLPSQANPIFAALL